MFEGCLPISDLCRGGSPTKMAVCTGYFRGWGCMAGQYGTAWLIPTSEASALSFEHHTASRNIP